MSLMVMFRALKELLARYGQLVFKASGDYGPESRVGTEVRLAVRLQTTTCNRNLASCSYVHRQQRLGMDYGWRFQIVMCNKSFANTIRYYMINNRNPQNRLGSHLLPKSSTKE